MASTIRTKNVLNRNFVFDRAREKHHTPGTFESCAPPGTAAAGFSFPRSRGFMPGTRDSAARPRSGTPTRARLIGKKPPGEASAMPLDTAERLFEALRRDFAAHGQDAIEAARKKQPATYLRLLSEVLPKEPRQNDPSETLSDDELRTAIRRLKDWLANTEEARADGPGAGSDEPPRALPPLSEAG
jgi:hypothetical protein